MLDPTLTQADLAELQHSEENLCAPDYSRRRFPSYVIKSTRMMLSYVIGYFGNVLHTSELEMWNFILQLDDDRTGQNRALEDFVLRLSCRKPTWFPVARLDDTYADMLAGVNREAHANEDDDVGTLSILSMIEILQKRAVPLPEGGTLVDVVDGSVMLNWLVTGDHAAVRTVLECIRMGDLKEIGASLRRRALLNPLGRNGSHNTTNNIVEDGEPGLSRRKSSRKRTNDLVVVDAPASASPSSPNVAILPDKKNLLIQFIIEASLKDPVLDQLMDSVIGPVVRVNPDVKKSLRHLLALFHVVSNFYPLTSSPGGSSDPPLPRSNVAVLATLGKVDLPMTRCKPLFFFANDATLQQSRAEETSVSGASEPRLMLFTSRVELDVYMEGLELQCELFEACEGYQRYKMRDVAFVDNVEKRVDEALEQIELFHKSLGRQGGNNSIGGGYKRKQHMAELLLRKVTCGVPTCGDSPVVQEDAHTEARSTSSLKRHRESDRDDESIQCPQQRRGYNTVEGLLNLYGFEYLHLTRYLPQYKWLECVEYLFEMLQMCKQYERANRWLRILLEYPVFQVRQIHTESGAVVCNIPFKYHRRGKWWHRIGQNLCQLDRDAEALVLMETTLEACGNASTLSAQISTAVARAHRLMQGVWTREYCEWNVTMECTLKAHLRRADRMSMERLQVRLHKPPRRWGPVPKGLLVSTVKEAEAMFLHGQRDTLGGGGWTDEAFSKSSQRVENFALLWFKKGCGRREKGWNGLHAEGSWFSLFCRIVLSEAFAWDGESREDGCTQSAPAARPPPLYLWLSPFQRSSLDEGDMIAFVRRREGIIRKIIASVRAMSQDAFVAMIKSRTVQRTPDGVPDQDDDDVVAGGEGGVDESANAASPCAPAAGDGIHSVDETREGCQEVPCSDAAVGINNDEVDEEEPLLESDDDGSDVETVVQQAECCSHVAPGPAITAADDGVKEYRVDITHMPEILEMAECLPIEALCNALECMFLSPVSEGYVLRYSGFPDLVLWRMPQPAAAAAGDGSRRRKATFLLGEVKSPTDRLSDKQIAVNDMLLRAGFNVAIIGVVCKSTIANVTAPRVRVVNRYVPPTASLQINRRTSSSFVKGTATNPVIL